MRERERKIKTERRKVKRKRTETWRTQSERQKRRWRISFKQVSMTRGRDKINVTAENHFAKMENCL